MASSAISHSVWALIAKIQASVKNHASAPVTKDINMQTCCVQPGEKGEEASEERGGAVL